MAEEKQEKSASKPAGKSPRNGQIFLLKVLLVLNMVLISLVVCVVLGLIPKPTLRASTTPPPQPKGYDFQQKHHAAKPVPGNLPPTANTLAAKIKPVSWRQAEEAFHGDDYTVAAEMFGQLVINHRHKPADSLVCDYFLLRQGQSLLRLGRNTEGVALLETLTHSHSPIICAVSEYELGRAELGLGKYLVARSRAYRAIGALGGLERPIPLERDCYFLIARALTEKVRSYKSNRKFVRWPDRPSGDPFKGLNKTTLRKLLAEGKGLLSPSALGPELTIRPKPRLPGRWEINALEMKVEELLNQFGHKSGRDVKWGQVNRKVRGRAVSLHFRSVSSQMLCEVAAGMTGLIGRFTLEKLLVYDPAGEGSVAKQSKLITNEAVSVWRRFFYRYPKDSRIPLGHFGLAAISEWNGLKIAAVREYQILAGRFERSPVAPEALLRCAKIKIDLLNYTGAKGDLLDMMDLYPNHPGIDDIYFLLGRVNEMAGQFDTAAQTFENLYHRNLSIKSRKLACLGAGRCHYSRQKYAMASKWLARYVAGFSEPNPNKYASAYFMLGKSEAAQGHWKVAEQAFYRGLLGNPGADIRIPTMMELARVNASQEKFIMALGVLEKLSSEKLSPAQATKKVVLTAEVFRAVGLADKARSLLRMELGAVKDPEQRGRLAVELARCHMAYGDNKSARTLLTQILPTIGAGRTLLDATTLLAEACLKCDEPAQALSLGEKVLLSNPPKDIARRVRQAMGEAYLAKKQYEKAALMFSGMDQDKTKTKAKKAPAGKAVAAGQTGESK
ncbi:MAG: hypothetical protein K8S55_04400 [Phycisphaerae bacterium]|nr:hypothetical protein [Phycisphaerae bacterium]